MSELQIRAAQADDVGDILRLIRALAEYEKLSHEVVATEDLLRAALFGTAPAASALLAVVDGRAIGFAVYFANFSTFLGRAGVYLEDLFVEPAYRGHGYGRALLQAVARVAVARGCARMDWSVLDWNAPSIAFYKSFGARAIDEWTIFRLSGEALQRFAAPSGDSVRSGENGDD